MLFGTPGPVQAFIDSSIYELERSRSLLLGKRDSLARHYQYLLRQSDELNRQLDQVQAQSKAVAQDIKRTDLALNDVECSLKSMH